MEYVNALSSIEVLVVNLIALDQCFKRKHSVAKTAAVLFAFTIVFMLSFTLLPSEVSVGNGEFSVLGFAYLLPLMLLYDGKAEVLLLSMCMSWTYSLGILSVSVQATLLLESLGLNIPCLAIETALFLATFMPFKTRLIPWYSYILRSTGKMQKMRSAHFKTSIYLNFFILLIIHIIFLGGDEYALQTVFVSLILASNYLFYRIVHEIVSGSLRIDELEIEALSDALTGLGNRAQAIGDVSLLMEETKTFSVVFLDLDRFKLVNDRFGHDAGDRYLKHFAQAFSEELRGEGKLYRFGGDEFVAIYHGVLTEESIGRMTECKNWSADAPCEFNGVSAGLVVCEPPYAGEDWNDVFRRADKKMYRSKMEKSGRSSASAQTACS